MALLKFLFVLSLVSFIFGEFIRIPFFGSELKLLDLSILLIFIGWFSYCLFTKNFKNIIPRFAYPFSIVALFSLILSISYLKQNEFLISLSYFIRLISYFSFLSLIFNFKKDFKTFIGKSFLILGLIIVAIGYIQFFLYPSLRNLFYLGWDEHLFRMFSVFLDPDFAGTFYVLYFLFVLNKFLENIKTKRNLIGYSMLLAVSFFAIFLTFSRGAIIALIVGSLIFLILKNKTKLAIFICLIATFLIILLPQIFKSEGTNLLRSASTQARISSYSQAINIYSKNLILGVGFNTYRFSKARYGYKDSSEFVNHAASGTDNSFLFVMATTGTLGILSYMYFWYKILKLSRDTLIIASIAAVFVNSFFINALFYSFILFWLFSLIGSTESN